MLSCQHVYPKPLKKEAAAQKKRRTRQKQRKRRVISRFLRDDIDIWCEVSSCIPAHELNKKKSSPDPEAYFY